MNSWEIPGQGFYSHDPSFGDINNDGVFDIVLFIDDFLYVFAHDGSTIWKKEVQHNTVGQEFTPVISDLDKDGNLEIVLQTLNTFYVFDNSGSILPGWPKEYSGSRTFFNCCYPVPAVGNIDDDEELEIILLDSVYLGGTYHIQTIRAFNIDGTLAWDPPIMIEGDYVATTSPVIGDINNDGKNEIIIAIVNLSTETKTSDMYVFTQTGSILTGWPQSFEAGFPGPISIADIDGDNFLEIIVGDSTYEGHIFEHNGVLKKRTPIILSTPVIHDIDGDYELDIMSSGSWQTVYGFDLYDNQLFSYHTEDGGPCTPQIHDIDKDGKAEIISSSSWNRGSEGNKYKAKLYVWETEFGYADLSEWPMFQHDFQHTGNYNFQPPQPTLQCSDGIDNDEDGLIDYPEDPGCDSANDNDETDEVCGNNMVEGSEQCDGTDDSACPGLCQEDCTCGTEPQKSMIDNTGTVDITGYLLMKIQKLSGGGWQDMQAIVDENVSRTVLPGTYLALDTIWAEAGSYTTTVPGAFRVYAAFRDEDGNVLVMQDGSTLEANYEFTVSG